MTKILLIPLAALALASCGSTTTTTVRSPDGKITTTVTQKSPPSDGVLTVFMQSLLGGFLSVFDTK